MNGVNMLDMRGLAKSLDAGAQRLPILGGVEFSGGAGLYSADAGQVVFDGTAVTEPPAGLAVVFQDYSRSLLRWKSNLANVEFGMRRLNDSAAAKREQAMLTLAAVGLAGALLLGAGLAALAARWSLLRRCLGPLVEMLRALPPPALVPLVIFIVGIGSGLFYFIVVFAAMWPIYIVAANALASADPVPIQCRSTPPGRWATGRRRSCFRCASRQRCPRS